MQSGGRGDVVLDHPKLEVDDLGGGVFINRLQDFASTIILSSKDEYT